MSVLRRAEILAIGSELLTPFRVDTNSLGVTERLNELGIEVRVKAVVGDNRDDLANVLVQALDRADLVVCTGGLGPTDDDVTREVAASVMGLALREDLAITERLRLRFASRGLAMPENNRRQAMVPEGATVLDNPRGTAPGLLLERDGRLLLLLPGPPRELTPMLAEAIDAHLAPRTAGRIVFRRILRIAGRTESHAEEAAQPVYARWRAHDPSVATTILAAPGQVELHLHVVSDDAERARRALDGASADLERALGPDVFSTDGRTLEEVVGDLLTAGRLRIAVAESCTGGLVLGRLTEVPGSSAYVEGGVVTYANASKVELLGVPMSLLEEHGAVSEPVALQMAEGVRALRRVDIGVGVTGIAGPGGGTDLKPVGTVVIAVAADRSKGFARTFRFPGERHLVRTQASQAALDMVRRHLIRTPE